MPAHRPPLASDAATLGGVARPKQARSRQTLERLLDAAEALIQEKGLADASIAEIARRAGSSVGGFYARFKDKNELLRALEERFFHELSGRVDALADARRWEGRRIAEIVRALAAELVAVVDERRNLMGAFLHRALHDEDSKAEALRFRARTAERVSRLLLGRRAELSHPEPGVGVELGVHFAFSLMLQSVLVGELRAGGRALDDRALAGEIARNFLAYIGAPMDPDAEPSPEPDAPTGATP